MAAEPFGALAAAFVDELREPFRSTLLLHYFEERSSEEIARHLGVPGSTVRNRVHRGVEMLRRRFLVEADDPKKNLAGLMALAFPGTASTAALVSVVSCKLPSAWYASVVFCWPAARPTRRNVAQSTRVIRDILLLLST